MCPGVLVRETGRDPLTVSVSHTADLQGLCGKPCPDELGICPVCTWGSCKHTSSERERGGWHAGIPKCAFGFRNWRLSLPAGYEIFLPSQPWSSGEPGEEQVSWREMLQAPASWRAGAPSAPQSPASLASPIRPCVSEPTAAELPPSLHAVPCPNEVSPSSWSLSAP